MNNRYIFQDIVEIANTHIRYLSFFYFMKKVTSGDIKCKNLKGILRDLCMLYGLSNLIKECKSCYESGYFEAGVAYSRPRLWPSPGRGAWPLAREESGWACRPQLLPSPLGLGNVTRLGWPFRSREACM